MYLALEKVTDYRTHVSGITPELLDASKNPRLRGFKEVQVEVAALMKDKVVIGHALKNDMRALLLNHPRRLVRDTSQYHEFRALAKGRSPALRKV
jgi:RNA exonuclease 4